MLAQLKKHLTPHELWEDAKFFFLLNLGLVATAVGIAVFKTPNHFAFGGTSGLSIVLATLFPRWNVGAFMWFIYAALVVLIPSSARVARTVKVVFVDGVNGFPPSYGRV